MNLRKANINNAKRESQEICGSLFARRAESDEIRRINEKEPKRFEGKSEETRRAIAEEEIVARACEDRLANSRLMKEFIAEMDRKESGLAQKFSNFLGEAISRLKKLFQQIASRLSVSEEAKTLRKLTNKLEAIQTQYDALLERRGTAAEATANSEQQKNTSDRGVMLMSRYAEGIDQLNDGTFDYAKNTHLLVLDKTPQIYIDKAKAKNLEIVMSWDIAYLAMKKKGEILGNYRGLGSEIMKKIPDAIKNPLYIVKQKNGRIAAISELVVKKNRVVTVSIELETFKTTVQSGLTKSDLYNLIVTVLDAKPNYLHNNIFSGKIVYNKNNETPAHFILRLKSLKKALPANDLAKVSENIISNLNESVNTQNSETEKGTMKAERNNGRNSDQAYLDAVEKGDAETARRIVDEAAKNAGYDKRVLHGTRSFGFTKLDTSFSDDKISFFATPSVETAKTYSGLYGTRGISEEANQDEIKKLNEKADGKTKQKFEEWVEKARLAGMQSKYLEADEIYNAIRKNHNDFLNGKISEYRMEEKQEGYLEKLIKKAYDKRAHGGESFGKWKNTNEYSQLLLSGLDFAYTFNHSETLKNKVQRSGNYDLYANTDGLFVIEGNGAHWNDLNSDFLPDLSSKEFTKYQDENRENKWTTRNVSRYAYDNGYKGVLFKNILDTGGEAISTDAQPADVYAFFDPKSQLKSADTITYDDNGNVIPLSERFNAKNDDIRYADRATYYTARELLLQAMADEEIKKSEVYSPLLREYANRVTELDKKYMSLEAAESEYVDSINAYDDAGLQEKYKKRVDDLSREISRIERDLSAQEEDPALKRLVLREKAATRRQTVKEARKDTASRMSELRKSIERKSTVERIEAKAKLLSKKLTENTRKSHIPDDLKQPLEAFLGSIKKSVRNSQYDYGTPADVEFEAATAVPASEQSNFVKEAKNHLKDLHFNLLFYLDTADLLCYASSIKLQGA